MSTHPLSVVWIGDRGRAIPLQPRVLPVLCMADRDSPGRARLSRVTIHRGSAHCNGDAADVAAAREVFLHRLLLAVGAGVAAMGDLDAVVFCGPYARLGETLGQWLPGPWRRPWGPSDRAGGLEVYRVPASHWAVLLPGIKRRHQTRHLSNLPFPEKNPSYNLRL